MKERKLPVVSAEEAYRRFEAALRPEPVGVETVALGEALGRVLARKLAAPIDVPPFDRAVADGYAVRAADVAAASEAAPVRLRLAGEVRGGRSSGWTVAPGTAAAIATGGPMPRGADAVVAAEHCDAEDKRSVLVRSPVAAGRNMSFAGSDLARGEMVVRRGRSVGLREIGLMAACGIGRIQVYRRPTVAVISTGDDLAAPGERLPPAGSYDVQGPMLAAAIVETGGLPLVFPIVPVNEARLATTLAEALASADFVILSGGPSKRAGDLTSRLLDRLGPPGVVVDGVAIKPGKPLRLAVAGGKGVAALQGFPAAAMLTFREFVAPFLRRLAGQPPRREATVVATVSFDVPSEIGRTDYVMVGLDAGADRQLVAHPVVKGQGAISAFAEADGFVSVAAPADHLAAGIEADVALFAAKIRAPDLVIAGSHCVGLEPLVDALAEAGIDARIRSIGSMGGLAAARRGECDIAPIHILHPDSGIYNEPFIDDGLMLVKGWRRRQGIVFRTGDRRFERRTVAQVIDAVAGDPSVLMVNRNAGAGTRFLIEGLLQGKKPEGWANQPKSHNAVAAAVAQGRADWGMAIATVATAYGLGFLPYADEHYDFAVVRQRAERPAVKAFLSILASPATGERLAALGLARD